MQNPFNAPKASFHGSVRERLRLALHLVVLAMFRGQQAGAPPGHQGIGS